MPGYGDLIPGKENQRKPNINYYDISEGKHLACFDKEVAQSVHMVAP